MFTRRGRESATEDLVDARTAADTAANAAAAARKGKPTPKRREAERERLERVKPTRDPRAQRKQAAYRKAEARKAMKEGMTRGDERYLPKRDQGPVRKALRDLVDGRLTAAEFFMPVAAVSLALMLAGANGIGGTISSMMVMLVLFDTLLLTVQVRKFMKVRFPEESRRGTASYAVMRALMWRSMRTPKPQVPRGYKP